MNEAFITCAILSGLVAFISGFASMAAVDFDQSSKVPFRVFMLSFGLTLVFFLGAGATV